MRTIIASLLVCVAGLLAFYGQTNGLTALTTETARRADIAQRPRLMPDAALLAPAGGEAGLRSLLQEDGRLSIVNFMYTRCVSICLAMGAEFQQLQQLLAERGWGDRVGLLSLSFDPGDKPAYLSRYATTQHADPALWRMATIAPGPRRQELLDAFGIIVVPAPYGQYEHNAAYHVVTPDGRLVRIFDLGGLDALEAWLSSRLKGGQQP